ncbi:MAG: glycosyltransferase family 2 protein [Elusimicrobiota bacterium]
MKSSLVLLVLNEIEGLKALWSKIPFHCVSEVFAVDGGSTDGSREFLTQQGVEILSQTSRGRGEAFRMAFKRAKHDAVVFFSPDGNEDQADIPKLLAKLEQGHDMAIASRFLPGAKNEEDEEALPWRLWANQGFTLLANFLWNKGERITDTINGYRAVTRYAFLKMAPDASGFVIEYQMSIRAMKMGLKVAEIATVEGVRIGGRSKAGSIPTGIAFLKFLAREMRQGKKNFTLK